MTVSHSEYFESVRRRALEEGSLTAGLIDFYASLPLPLTTRPELVASPCLHIADMPLQNAR